MEKIEPLLTQMEQWSILRNVLNYVQHSRFHSMNHTLEVNAVNKYKHKPNTDNREFKELDFGTTPQKLQEEYMDIYEGIHSDIVISNRFDENYDLSTTYLGRVDKRNQQLKVEDSFLYQNMVIPQVNYWMTQNVNYCWTQAWASPSYQNHFICSVSHSTLYQNLIQKHKGYKLEMVNVLVYYLLYQ